MIRRGFLTIAAAAMTSVMMPGAATAQDVTLRLHQFLPPPATVPKDIIKPWAARVEEAAGGKLKIEHYDAMTLGGRPPDLYDQAVDGVADIIMTVTGYTPGRFLKTEVFELPFMMTNPVATSMAFQDLVDSDLQDGEYKDVKVLGAWVHGPGLIHTANPVNKLEDLQGVKLRGPTRVINDLLNELGATPVGMPLPAIPEALSKGVISGTVIPWEVTPAIRLSELVTNHLEFSGDEAIYTATIIMVMNKQKYDSLPEDVRQILEETAKENQAFVYETAAQLETDLLAKLKEGGMNVNTADKAAFIAASKPIYEEFSASVPGGKEMVEQAISLGN